MRATGEGKMEGGRKSMAPGLLGHGVYTVVKRRLGRIKKVAAAAAAAATFTYSRNMIRDVGR